MAYNPAQPIQLRVEIYIAPLGWVDITARGRKASCQISQGRSAGSIQAESARLNLSIGNADGYVAEDNPSSPWYPYIGRGCLIRVSRLGLTVSPAQRFYGRIDTLVGKYPGGGVDAYTEITAMGTIGILGQGSESLKSAMRRGIPLDNPTAYWALEESLASSVAGGTPMSVLGQVNFGTNSGHPGSAPLPDYTGGGQLRAPLPNGSTSNSWRAEFTARFGTGSDSIETFSAILDITSPFGDVTAWEFLATDALTLTGRKAAGFTWTGPGGYSDAFATDAVVDDGQWHHFRADVAQSGGNIAISLTVDGVLAGSKTAVGKTLNSTKSSVVINPLSEKSGGVGAVGHFTWWSPHVVTSIDTTVLATGHNGETAADRMARLCDEEGIDFELTGTAADTAAMGPQLIDTLLANLRDCENADMGLMHDNGTDGAIGYVTRTSLYNQTANLSVTNGAITPDLEAIWDNQYVRNDVTSSRPNGGSAQVTDDDHITKFGAHLKGDRQPNVETDAQLEPDAGWAVHIGVAPGARYNSLGINLRNTQGATLADQVAGHVIGDRITVAKTALAPQAPPDGIDVLTIGWTEILDEDTWLFRPNVVPYSPFGVFVLDSATRGRLDGSHKLVAAVNATATSWLVGTTAGPLITAVDADDGFQWMVDGELVTVTDVATTSVTFVSAGTASTGSSGSRTPGLPAGVGTGDLVLIFASTRNSGTGIPQLAVGWDQIFLDENIALYARLYDGSGAGFMPTITFSGGAANEDTIAQSAAFRGTFASTDQLVVAVACCLNASAQDITTPGIPVNQLPDDLMAIYFGWKQDDYTSVATPGSWTEIQEASSTAGNDASQVWGYRQFTSTPAAGSLQPAIAVTGGAAAISRGGVLLIYSDYQTVTVTRSVNGVSKSHAFGAVPHLHPAPHLAL